MGVCAAGLGLRPFPAIAFGAVSLLFFAGFALELVARFVEPILQRLFVTGRLTIFRLLVFILLVFVPIFVHFLYSFDENTSLRGLIRLQLVE